MATINYVFNFNYPRFNFDSILGLPEEDLTRIISNLPLKDLVKLAQVSSVFHRLTFDFLEFYRVLQRKHLKKNDWSRLANVNRSVSWIIENVHATPNSRISLLPKPEFPHSLLKIICYLERQTKIQDIFHYKKFDQAERDAAFQFACAEGKLFIAAYLVDKGAQIDSLNEKKDTPLYLACEGGHLPVVQFLVQRGANLFLLNNSDMTPLHSACHNGHSEVVNYLISVGALKNRSIDDLYMHLATQNDDNLEVVRILLDLGASLLKQNNHGDTPLHIALRSGADQIAKLLIKHHAPLDQRNDRGKTPLHIACFHDNEEVVKLLLHAGAEVSAANDRGNTALHIICMEDGGLDEMEMPQLKELFRKKYEIVKELISHGAPLNAVNQAGKMPLHLAIGDGMDSNYLALNYEIVKYLADHGAPIDARDLDGNTPLHLACQAGLLEAVTYLIEEKGATTTVVNTNNKLPMDLAKDSNHLDVVNYLSKKLSE